MLINSKGLLSTKFCKYRLHDEAFFVSPHLFYQHPCNCTPFPCLLQHPLLASIFSCNIEDSIVISFKHLTLCTHGNHKFIMTYVGLFSVFCIRNLCFISHEVCPRPPHQQKILGKHTQTSFMHIRILLPLCLFFSVGINISPPKNL